MGGALLDEALLSKHHYNRQALLNKSVLISTKRTHRYYLIELFEKREVGEGNKKSPFSSTFLTEIQAKNTSIKNIDQ